MTAPHRVIVESFAAQAPQRERGIPTYLADLLSRVAGRSGITVGVRTTRSLPPIGVDSALHQLMRTDRQLAEDMNADPTPWVHVNGCHLPVVPSGSRHLPQWVREARPGLLAIVFDIIPWIFSDRYLPAEHQRQRYLAHVKALKTLDHVMTISDSARDDLLTWFDFDPERVTTIGTGVDRAVFSPGDVDRTDPLVAGTRDIVLVVGGGDPRKNIPGLITAWAGVEPGIRDRHRLAIACHVASNVRDTWVRHIGAEGLTQEEVTITGTVSRDALVNLYRAAKLVVFPSMYEGYGLPIAEAASVGAPVICSNTSSMPAIIGDPTGTFDPRSTRSITLKIEECLSDAAMLDRLSRSSRDAADRLGWDPVVDRFLECTERHARRPRSITGAPRLGLIAPDPSAVSGVAAHTALVAEQLARIGPIEVFRDGGGGSPDGGSTRALGVPASALGRWCDPHPRSQVVAVIGNSSHHSDALRHALRHPSHVWFHDLNLDGLVHVTARSMHPTAERVRFLNTLADLAAAYPAHALATPTEHSGQWMRSQGHRFIEPLIRGARTVIVNTRRARDIVAATGMIDDERITVIPLGHRTPTVTADRSDRPTIVALGVVGPSKDPELAIRALARLDGDARLVFAGPSEDPGYRMRLEALASRLGVGERVVFTGALDDDEYWRWCQRAWLGLQLRRWDHGEASGTVLDLMAAGTPTVSGVPSSGELPAGTVVVLPDRHDEESVADALGRLLTGESERHSLGAAGLAHARSWTHRDVAEALWNWLSLRGR